MCAHVCMCACVHVRMCAYVYLQHADGGVDDCNRCEQCETKADASDALHQRLGRIPGVAHLYACMCAHVCMGAWVHRCTSATLAGASPSFFLSPMRRAPLRKVRVGGTARVRGGGW